MEGSTADFDTACMELAIAEACKSPAEDARLHPVVGVVAAQDRTILGTAFRGESGPGNHAEYVLLEHKLREVSLVGSTIYTTLEPCTSRHHARIPCVERLIQRRVERVFVGMLEPNPYLSGRGVRVLRDARVAVEIFPPELLKAVEGLNGAFLRAAKDSRSPERLHLSGYEWDLLETEGIVAGRSQQGWYEYFLATGDLTNLERLRQFYTPRPEQVIEAKTFDIPAGEPPPITVPTDLRLIQFVMSDPARLLALTPREFERFTAELLDQLGYASVEIGRGSKDGGVDVSAYIEHPLGVERVIVQCKRHSLDHKVGEPVIKQLLADAKIHNAARGLLVTTSYLTRGARLLVETFGYRLSALDYDELLRILRGQR